MCGCVNEAIVLASRSNRSLSAGSAASAAGRILIATGDRAGVSRLVHFSHATGAKRRLDLVGSKADSRRKWHEMRDDKRSSLLRLRGLGARRVACREPDLAGETRRVDEHVHVRCCRPSPTGHPARDRRKRVLRSALGLTEEVL